MAKKNTNVNTASRGVASIDAGLDLLLKKSDKKAKAESRLMRASDMPSTWRYIDFIDVKTGTPCLPLEFLFGTRGMLTGRVLHVTALEATGKSSFLSMLYGAAQRTGGAWIHHNESEAAPTPPDFMASLGVDPSKMLIEQPGSVTQCLQHAKDLIQRIRREVDPEKKFPIITGIDSVSALASGDVDVETGEVDGDSTSLGKHAREFSKFFREDLDFFDRQDAVLISTAQLKANIVTGPGAFAAPKTTSVAEGAFKYHASWIVNMTHADLKDQSGQSVGERVMATTKKNKLAGKGRTIEMHLYRDGRGWDMTQANVNLLCGSFSPFPDEFKSAGGWYSHPQLGTGQNMRKEEFVAAFYANEELVHRCREALRIRGFGFEFESKYCGVTDE